MSYRKPRQRPGARLLAGAVVLERSRLVDTSPVATPLHDFAVLHHAYRDAQQAVAAARADVGHARTRLTDRDRDRNAAIVVSREDDPPRFSRDDPWSETVLAIARVE